MEDQVWLPSGITRARLKGAGTTHLLARAKETPTSFFYLKIKKQRENTKTPS
jgi:hypothetical protein